MRFILHLAPLCVSGLLLSALTVLMEASDALPVLPRLIGDLGASAPTLRTIAVPAGGDVQAALDAAQPGDVVTLANGAPYIGNFYLPAKPGMTADGGGWITIRPASLAGLPAAGTRVDPALHAALMPKLVSPNVAPALHAARSAAGWRIEAVEFTLGSAASSVYGSYGLVELDGAATSLGEMPARITLSHAYIHGTPTHNTKRGVLLNGIAQAIVDSYVSDIHVVGQETQAVAGYAGPGPFKIVNNYLEGAGMGLLFGGADPRVAYVSPSDIEFRRNHVYKPLAWRGMGWTVKNAFELKHAKRVLVEGNVFENSWPDAQTGWLMVLTALSESNAALWTTVSDVTVRYNVFRHGTSGINVSSRATYTGMLPTEPMRRIAIAHNAFVDLGTEPQLGGGLLLWQVNGDVENMTIEHNTGAAPASFLSIGGTGGGMNPYMTALVVRNNLIGHGSYGLFGDAVGVGTVALTAYAPDALFSGNVIYGTSGQQLFPSLYPSGNSFPSSSAATGLVTGADGLAELGAGSSYLTAGVAGSRPGADLALVRQYTTSDVGGIAPPTDTVAPTISAVVASGITLSSATIAWITNEGSDAQIEYGITTAYGLSSALNASLVTAHSVTLNGLSAATTYHYRVRCCDGVGNLAVSADATFTTSSSTVAKELVGHWKLDDGSGLTAIDASGASHPGVLSDGTTWAAGKLAGAAQFDAYDDAVVVDGVAVDTVAGGRNTVAFWMKWNGGSDQMPFGWNHAYDLYFSGSSFGINTGQSNLLGISSSGLANRWVHVAVVFPNDVPTPSTAAIYIDGVAQQLSQQVGVTGDSRTATNRVVISGWGYGAGYKFGGLIDDVRIYNYALSASEVSALATVPNQLPVARISAAPSSGVAPLPVSFSGASSSDADGTITSYAWSFGDGASGSGSTQSHAYASAGNYTATLTVTDDRGASASTFATVTALAPPIAKALVGHWKLDDGTGTTAADATSADHGGTLFGGATWTTGAVAGAVQFDGIDDLMVADGVAVDTTAGGCNTVAFWMKWGGGDSQMPFGWNAAYDLWRAGGSFGINTGNGDILGIPSTGLAGRWVHVAVVFPNGMATAANARIYIDGIAQAISQRINDNGGARTATSRVQLSGWGIGDGYRFGGAIDDLRIYNHELSAAEVAAIAGPVTPPPATLAAGPASIAVGQNVTVGWSGIASPTATDWIGVYATGAADDAYISWAYADGSAAGSVTFTLAAVGTYELRLFANGGWTRLAVSNVVTVTPVGNQPPVAAMSASTTTGRAPLPVTFDASGSRDPEGGSLTYHWNFGDGSAAVGGAVTTHTYNGQGTYLATVTVTDGQGASDSSNVIITVRKKNGR
jgi:PKD repeat protein